MKVSELMTRSLVTLAPEDLLSRATTLGSEKRIRHFPVLDDDALVGIVTERDIFRAANDALRVRDVMTRALVTISPDDDVTDAALTMLSSSIGCLPVVENGTLVGLVTESDILRFVAGV